MAEKLVIFPKNKEELVTWSERLFNEFEPALKETKDKLEGLEEMWRCNHWFGVKKTDNDEIQPVTPTIWSLVENVLADLMDNRPENNLIGRTLQVKDIADLMERNIKAFYKRDRMEDKYMTCCRRALKFPAGIMRVTFDPDQLNGKGDVSLTPMDMRKCFWDPEYEDIQDGRAFFHRDYEPWESIVRRHPELEGKEIVGDDEDEEQGNRTKGVEGHKQNGKVRILEAWYRKPVREVHEITDVVIDDEGNEEMVVVGERPCTRYQLHMAELVADKVVYWSEDDEYNKDGVYKHGQIPFVFCQFFPLDGQPIGLSLIEIFQKLAKYADKMDQFILKNAYRASHERNYYNKEMVDPSDVKDRRNELVGVDGDPRAAIFTHQTNSLNADAYNKKRDIIDTIKDESGQNQFNRGEGGRGVTSAAGLRALKQFGAKRSRTMGRNMYTFYDKVTEQVLALMLQYYTPDRWQMFIEDQEDWSIERIDEVLHDVELWQFGVESKVQRNTAEDSWYYMELAFALMDHGFPPEACLKIMEFDGKASFEASLEEFKDEQERINAMVQQKVDEIMAQQGGGVPATMPPEAMGPMPTEDGGTLI